jgi:Chemoreceptor zinc-binding domain
MDFNEAIKAHSAWKQRLNAYAARPDGSLKPSDLERDNLCDLGRWIQGEGKTLYAAWPEFAALKTHHAEFHKSAGTVLRRIAAGTYRKEELALGGSSAYSTSSGACVSAIMALKQKMASAAAS